LGLRGKPSGKLEIGADLQLVRDKNEYNVQGATAALPAAVLLPDISTRRTTLKLFGQYALQSNLAVRVDFAHDRYHTNDWTWTDWAYADGTTVTQTPRTQVSLIGLSVIYRMW
jgi:hypothetical protein